eukprot:m.223931 g.223931  ORF g.223931 m.223931 type:complete len:526 (-) comp15145_c0_seq4:231-1808(-)
MASLATLRWSAPKAVKALTQRAAYLHPLAPASIHMAQVMRAHTAPDKRSPVAPSHKRAPEVMVPPTPIQSMSSDSQNNRTTASTPNPITNVDEIDFQNPELAFKLASTSDLVLAFGIFTLCSNERFVKNSLKLYLLFSKVVPKPILEAIVRHTFFRHFCGGEDEAGITPTVARLRQQGIGSILDYAAEADITTASENLTGIVSEESKAHARQYKIENEAACDENLKRFQICIENVHNVAPQGVAAIKLSALCNPDLLRHLSDALLDGKPVDGPGVEETLTKDERHLYERFKWRLDSICGLAHELEVHLLIDAEQTFYQPIIDYLTYQMQKKYNRNSVTHIYNTYQCYLTDANERLKRDYLRSQEEGFHFAAKLVRGAYLEEENALAERLGVVSPIFPTKQGTDDAYRQAIDFLVQAKPATVLIASHNDESIKYTISRMQEHDTDKPERVQFAQLYGMSDGLTASLGEHNFQVYKYVPYGPVLEVVPYLLRRVNENHALLRNNAALEFDMIKQELKRRLFGITPAQ